MKLTRYFLMALGVLLGHLSFSQANLHYRTVTNANGNWNTNAVWETSSTGGNPWSAATAPPNSTSRTITIRNNTTITIPAGYSADADELTVSSGTLTIANTGSLSIVDGTGIDLNNQGTINNNGTVSVSGSFQNSGTTSGFTAANTTFLSGSRYIHGFTNSEGVVPLATWNTGSVMEVAGYTSSITGSSAGNWSQAFYDVEINLASLTNSTRVVNFQGFLNNITHDLRVLSTGGASGGRVRMSQTNNTSMSVGGNLSISASTRLDITNGATGVALSVAGNVTNSGTFTMSFSASGTSTLNVGGNLSNQTGAIITTSATLTSATTGIGTINFNTATTHFFTNTGTISNHIRYIIPSGSVVDMGTSAMTGSGTFTLSGELRVGSTSANGAIQLGTGAGSNLQNTGTRTYNSGSTIHYNGTALQYIGNGYPPPSATGVHLIINNSNGVSVAAAVTSVEVTGNLTLNAGILNISNKHLLIDANIIQNAASSTITVNTSSDITVNGSGALGTFPFAAGPQSFRNFTLNRTTSGSVIFANPVTLGGVVTLTDGHLIFNDQILTLNGTFTATSGMLSSNVSSTLNIGGTGAFGTLVFDPANDDLLALSIDRVGGGTVGLSGSLSVVATIDLLNGDFTNGGGLSISDGLYLTRASGAQLLGARPTLLSGSYNVFYQGSAMTTGFELPLPSTPDLNNLTINGGTVTLTQDLTINGDFTANSSDLDGSTFTITMRGLIWDLNGGAFTPSSSTVIFDGNTTVSGFVNPAFHHLQLTSSASLTLPAIDTYVSGDLSFASGSVYIHSDGAVALNGSTDQAFNGNGHEFYTVRISKVGGEVNITSSLPMIHLFDIQTATVINTNNHLLLQSKGITTAQDASIGPVADGATINGNVTMQRYMDAIGNTFRYLAAPTAVVPPSNWGSNINYYSYNAGVGSWKTHSITTPLSIGVGYAVKIDMTNPVTWSVSGGITPGSSTWNFPEAGWHLLGNPYPSAIRWFDSGGVAWELNNISTTIAVTDNSIIGYPNYFRYWSYNPADNPTDWGTGEMQNGVIAMGQSFWVYVGTGGGSLTIHEAAKYNDVLLFGEFYRKQPTASPQLKLMLDNGEMADVAYLKLHEKASRHFDFRYDLKKLWNDEMDIYLVDPDGNELVMNTIDHLDKDMNIPVGIKVKVPGTYTLSFMSTDGFSNFDYYLIDTFEGKATAIANGSYTFTVSDISLLKSRFYLSHQNTGPEKKTPGFIQTYPNPVTDILYIQVPAGEKADMKLLDEQGRLHASAQIQGTYQLNMADRAQGMYILKLWVGNEMIIQKIIK